MNDMYTTQQIHHATLSALMFTEGTDMQIAAENMVYDALEQVATGDQWDAYGAYCLKATLEERINEATRIIRTCPIHAGLGQ